MTSSDAFVSSVAALRMRDCFNPYSELCAVHDLPLAPKNRLEILNGIVEHASRTGIDAIWVGRDLGYRGGRRTGLAFTDDIFAPVHAARWQVDFKPTTNGPPVAERSAKLIWSVLELLDARVLLWNVFPLHPYQPGSPFTNRNHSASERRVGEELLAALIEMTRPETAIGIGEAAQRAVVRLMPPGRALGVRHPSYGGQAEFLRGMRDVYGC
jgi:hypothetical protein